MGNSFLSKLHPPEELHQHLLTGTWSLDKLDNTKPFAPESELAAHLTDLRLLAPSPAMAPSPANT